MTQEYDLVILGGGVGGYVAAIRAAQLKMSVAIIEKDQLGGTCLHKGCIPSKTFLKSAEIYQQTKHVHDFGVKLDQENIQLDFKKIQQRKDNVIQTLHHGLQSLMKKHRIDIYHGFGRILGPSIFSPLPGAISIEYDDDRDHTILVPKHVLIATGSSPKRFKEVNDHPMMMTSEEALEMETLPTSMMIVGGGVIGIEWASMLADFDVNVTVIEQSEEILPEFDRSIAEEVRKRLQQKGVQFLLKVKMIPESIQSDANEIKVRLIQEGKTKALSAERMLVAIGRKANADQIGLENTEIMLDHEFIQVNQFYQTKESHIYAIGDVIGGMQLAHVASHEGIVAVEHMAGKDPWPISYDKVPHCIYSDPEVASVGQTEEEAKSLGIDVNVSTFPFQANGKSIIEGSPKGFIKMIAHKKTEDILGIHMVGPQVTNMISEGSLAMLLNATPWEMTENIYPHPSLSEVIGEAAMAIEGRQIHGG